MNDHSELTVAAIEAALKAGEILRKGFGTSFEISSKPGRQNLVTAYDKSAESCIISSISSQFPNHQFLAEESGSTSGSGSVLWVIDPLDGTVNFAHGIPVFSISIAATIDQKIVSGVIYQPMLNELFIAEKGKGAYLNGDPLRVSSVSSLDEAFLATGFPYNVDENPLGCIDSFAKLTKMGIPIRRLGSAAIDLAYTAAGRFDGYWEVSLHPWDMAAGKLLVEEAGGRVSHYNGAPHETFCETTMLATNGHIHEQLMKRLM
jgi:myo-inositol-1(or 4)-monophosphatase